MHPREGRPTCLRRADFPGKKRGFRRGGGFQRSPEGEEDEEDINSEPNLLDGLPSGLRKQCTRCNINGPPAWFIGARESQSKKTLLGFLLFLGFIHPAALAAASRSPRPSVLLWKLPCYLYFPRLQWPTSPKQSPILFMMDTS